MASKTAETEEYREMRIRKVPSRLHRMIVAHQKLLSLKQKKDLSLDEACIDLWQRATSAIEELQS